MKRFGYFRLGRHSGFSKVTRRKGGTVSSRYLNDGYTHKTPTPTIRHPKTIAPSPQSPGPQVKNAPNKKPRFLSEAGLFVDQAT